jgi:hypothetical protein
MRTPRFFGCPSGSTIFIDPGADVKWESNEAGEDGASGGLITTAFLLLGADTGSATVWLASGLFVGVGTLTCGIWPGINGLGTGIVTGGGKCGLVGSQE